MSCAAGSNISKDQLIFHLDFNNTQNCWKGVPTTNLVPTPSVNARFNVGNYWDSIQTVQYNSGVYFSIGTIDNITDNIVTLATVDHVISTFDVLTPETTGGGVTAGTNYYIKKISETTFTLHLASASEDGSLGYIDPYTTYHKVHDSIALDERVEINETDFPTSWIGPANAPNSVNVKEIVEGEGPEGQNIMRIHVHRLDNVQGGMAYGVLTPVTIGDVVSISWWQRNSRSDKGLDYSNFFGDGFARNLEYDILTEAHVWEKKEFSLTSENTYDVIHYFQPKGSSDYPYYIDICDFQVEVNKASGATPFVEGERDNTQSLYDLARTIPVYIAGYPEYTDNSMIFPNVNTAYIAASTPDAANMRMGTSDFTLSTVIEFHDSATDVLLEGRGLDGGYLWLVNYSGTLNMSLFLNYGGAQYQFYSINNIIPIGEICVLDAVIDRVNSEIRVYINSILKDTITITHTESIDPTSGDYYMIGYDKGGHTQYYTMYSFHHYKKALSETEIKRNFYAKRRLYGI